MEQRRNVKKKIASVPTDNLGHKDMKKFTAEIEKLCNKWEN